MSDIKTVDAAEFLKSISKDTPENQALILVFLNDLVATTTEP